MSGKHFSCECVRCRDPTELKTFASAILCSCGGTVTASDPLDLTQDALWRCEDCSLTVPALQVATQERDVTMEINTIQRDDVRGLEDFLTRYQKLLHPNHASMMEAKKHLSVGYGRFPGFTFDKLSTEKLKRKISFCGEVLDFVRILEPGLSTQKALTLYELWLGEKEMAERLKTEKKFSQSQYEAAVREALKYLEESSQILKYEPLNSIHGQLSQEVDIKLSGERIKLSELK